MGSMDKKKYVAYGAGILLSVIGVSAIVSGIWLIVQPDGTGLKLSVDLLKDSPFENYLIPGIALLTVNGLLSIVGAVLSFMKHRYAGIAAIVVGALLIIWVSVQLYWIGWENWLQPTFLGAGVVEMALGLLLDSFYHENRRFFGGHHGSHAH
jgi:hypothetical protein